MTTHLVQQETMAKVLSLEQGHGKIG